MSEKRKIVSFLSVCLTLTILLSTFFVVFSPMSAYAVPNEKIDHIVVVGGEHTGAMESAVLGREDIAEDTGSGGQSPILHFSSITDFSGADGYICGADCGAKKVGVVVWYGESGFSDNSDRMHESSEYAGWFNHDKTFDMFENYVSGQRPADGSGDGADGSPGVAGSQVGEQEALSEGEATDIVPTVPVSLIGHHDAIDSSAGLEAPEYNGTGLGRGLSGYDVYYLTAEPTGLYAPMENPAYTQYQSDLDAARQSATDAGLIFEEPSADEAPARYVPDPSKPLMRDVMQTTHIHGMAEPWLEAGAKVYVAGLGPYDRRKDNVGSDHNDHVVRFNSALKGHLSGPKWIKEVFEWIQDHHPYYGFQYDEYDDGGDSLYNASTNGKPWYSKATFRDIFYMFWYTVLDDNPNDPAPETVDQSFYSVTSSLTSYMNKTLSWNADEKQKDHKASEIEAVDWTSAGSFMGYGDRYKPYKFENSGYITTNNRIQSVASYSALVDVDNKHNLYTYARYGRLLADLGLDNTGFESVVAPENMISGAVLWFLYLMSAVMPFMYNALLLVLKILNPFSLMSVGAEFYISGSFPDGWTWINNFSMLQGLFRVFGAFYVEFSKLGVFTVIPLCFVFMMAGVLIRRTDGRNGHRVRNIIIRALFILVGIPVIGSLYTATLNTVTGALTVKSFASTELIAGCFDDFEAWARNARLEPASGMTLVSESSSVSDSGRADGASLRDLRKNAYILNKVLNVLDYMNEFDTLSGVNDLKWNSAVLELKSSISGDLNVLQDGLGLIRRFMLSTFYSAPAFEGESMSRLSSELSDAKRGYRVDPSKSDPPDMTGTLYDFFDLTNEKKDWTDREHSDNVACVTSSGEHSGWADFNIISNGGTIGATGKTPNSTCRFSGSYSGGDNISPRRKSGLSSLSMYNYLTTVFGPTDVAIYSRSTSTSSLTAAQHYSVNMIGSGWMRTVYYLNMVVILITMCILGFVYGLGMLTNNVKRCFTVLSQLPGAALGVIRSVVSIITTIVLMCSEIIITVVLFATISDLIVSIIGYSEDFLSNVITCVGVTNGAEVVFASRFGVGMWLFVQTLALGFVNFVLVKYAPVFLRVSDKVMYLVLLLCGVPVRNEKRRLVSEKLPSSKTGVLVIE